MRGNFGKRQLLEGEQEIARLTGLAGCMEDGAVILFEDGQPMAQIVSMAHLRRDIEMGGQKSASQFGNQFFAGIGGGTEAVCQIARQPGGMRRPVAIMPISA